MPKEFALTENTPRTEPGMDIGRVYNRDPIREAVLEFRFPTIDESDFPQQLERLDFGRDFGSAKAIYSFEGTIEVGDAGEVRADTSHRQIGWRYVKDDASREIHVATNRFTFISRGQYGGWARFLEESEAAWGVAKPVLPSTEIEIVAARYVNHIDLPNNAIDIKDYLRLSIDIPARLPQTLSRMFMQVDIPLGDLLDGVATVTSAALDPREAPPLGALLLDVDVKANFEVPTTHPDFDTLLRTQLKALRYAKNYVFEACITDATRNWINS